MSQQTRDQLRRFYQYRLPIASRAAWLAFCDGIERAFQKRTADRITVIKREDDTNTNQTQE